MNNGYTHLISYEAYNKFLKMWTQQAFRTVASSVAAHYKTMSTSKHYRNVKIEAI